MQERHITLHGKTARFYTFANPTAKQTAHFYGGNGFALGVYEPLLSNLHRHFQLSCLAMRGEWLDKPSDDKLTREQDAELLIEFLQKTQDKPVIGIGHSQGATATTMACAKCPELFSHLFLLEPVSFTKQQTTLYNLAPRRVKMTQEPFKSTATKQANWQSVDEYFAFLRQHSAYRRISDEHLQIYAKNSLEQGDDGGLTLRFPPNQELANYFGTPYITDALRQVIDDGGVPVHLIIGKPSMFISPEVRDVWATFVPSECMTVLPDYGHLLPLENPDECVRQILRHMD